MEKSNEEYQIFNKVIDEVFSPVAEECKDEINDLLNREPELKSNLENKLQQILKKRNGKSI